MNLLLLHGFTSHPVLTLGPLPQVLREAGFQVSQPALPGHGTRPEDLLKVRWQDWLETARAFYRELPEPRGVVGFSMGALLSAHLAAETPTQALVALAPAMALKHPLAPLAPLLAWLIPRFPGPDSIQDPELKKQNPNYPYFPTRALLQLLALMRRTPEVLPKVKANALVIEAGRDKVVAPEGVRRTPEVLPKVKANALVIEAGRDKVVAPEGVRSYHALLGSQKKDYLVFPESGHDLLLDRDREAVAQVVRDWLIANSNRLQ